MLKEIKFHYKVIQKGVSEPFFEGLNSTLDGAVAGVKAVLTGISKKDHDLFKIEINILSDITEILD